MPIPTNWVGYKSLKRFEVSSHREPAKEFNLWVLTVRSAVMESNYCFPSLPYLGGGRINDSIYVICSIVAVDWQAYLSNKMAGVAR
jgi:hypothetical protein